MKIHEQVIKKKWLIKLKNSKKEYKEISLF